MVYRGFIIYCLFVSDIAIYVLKRDVKLQPTNQPVYCSFLPSATSAKFGSRYIVVGLSERDKIWQFDRGGLAIYLHPDW